MAVSEAIKAGYRHIDAAACYDNEKILGIGINMMDGMMSDNCCKSPMKNVTIITKVA